MAAKDDAPEVEYVSVKAGPKLEPGRVALWERHPDHPYDELAGDNEVFVPTKDNAPVKVAVTPLVERKLLAGELVKATGSAAKSEDPEELKKTPITPNKPNS